MKLRGLRPEFDIAKLSAFKTSYSRLLCRINKINRNKGSVFYPFNVL